MKIERKIYAITLVCILLSTIIIGVIGTRTITNTSDTVTGGTYIYNGNYAFGVGSSFNLTNATIKGAVRTNTLLPFGTRWNTTSLTYAALWNITKSVVTSNSAKWNSSYSVIGSKGASWNSSASIVLAKSGTWNATSSLVASKSAAWNASGTPGYNVTYIMNSKGDYWTATAANLQLAIYDLNSTNGGTVYIPKTLITFTSAIKLISNLRLLGVGVDSTVLEVGAGYSDVNSYGLLKALTTSRLNNITISDMKLEGHGRYALITMRNVSDITLMNLVVKNASGDAICLLDNPVVHEWNRRIMLSNIKCFYTTVYQSLDFSGNDSIINGIYCYNDTGAGGQAVDFSYCHNVSVSNIIIHNASYGIKFGADSDMVVNNIIVSQTRISDGVNVYLNCQNISFNNIKIYSDLTSLGNGMVITGCKYINVNNLQICGCGNVGCYIGNGGFVNLNNFIIKRTNAYGLEVDTANNCSISNGQIYNPTSFGVYLLSSKYVSFNLVTVSSGVSAGFECTASNNFKILGCTSNFNTRGIDTTNGGANTKYLISDCSCISNSVYGIDYAADTCFSIIGCTVRSSGSVGVYGTTATNYSIINCNVSSNGNAGILIAAGSNITIQGCSIKSNSAYGLDITATGFISISGNIIWKNTGGQFHDAITGLTNKLMIYGNIGDATCYSFTLPTVVPTVPHTGSMYVNVTTGLIGVYSGSVWLWH